MIKFTDSGRADFNWPPIAICAVLFGFVIAIFFSRAPGKNGPADLLERLFAPHHQAADAIVGQVLIISANPGDQLTAVTTLSPRGFHPLLAGSDPEVLSQIQAYPGAVKLAVVDATLPDYPRIARTLKSNLPDNSIVILKSPHRSDDIAPMLLERLASLRQFL
jgi:hypothetical protein